MTKDDLNTLVFPAMRYALGRKTYIVEMVCRTLIRNAKDIRSDIRYKMGEEIAYAINSQNAGMEMDVNEWQKVLKEFSKVIE